MLACARIGAVHSVVFGGFAAPELAARIDDAAPKVVVSASCGIETSRVLEYMPILDRAIALSSRKPSSCVILQRPQAPAALTDGRDLDWEQAMADAEPADCVPVAATDPLYILYTSGTTGKPKGVVRDNGGHAVALRWSMQYIYDTDPGEVFWAASDIGWVVGHSYIVYAPLLAGCTSVLYEGKPVGTPDAGAFWRVVAEHKVKTLFTAPTAFRAIKKEDPAGDLARKYDLSVPAVPVPGRGTARPGNLPVGGRTARHPGDRPLVADRDRLGDRGRPDGTGPHAHQARLAHRAGTGLRRAHRRPRHRRRRPAGQHRRHRRAVAAAARVPADLVGG
jgi:acyl-coenzyme A synthetase/AMP-(fatty) acid ligase